MSLALIQGYSSAEEEIANENSFSSTDEDDEEHVHPNKRLKDQSSFSDPPKPTSASSLLPSAFDAFSEIAGPPEFLNNSVTEHVSDRNSDLKLRHGGRKNREEKKELPPGVVVEAKAQLVGIRDRVRSDAETGLAPTSAMPPPSEGKRVLSATIPGAEDAAELLRMCMQCGVPKTYSNARGMVCPICGDRPPPDPDKELEKKKGSTIKDKEKSKRMRGQSSHATWKTETEMHLRQQFD